MTPARGNRRDIVCFILIGISELAIFFNNPGHFFMGDTLLWMGYRYHSITEFLKGFLQPDPTLWYRPLAQRTVESLLYPLAGLHPVPYRIVIFILFFACTIAVFKLTECITESRRAAWIATLFFAPHVTHAFATYDTAFVPEMVFTLFYIGAVISYVRYLRAPSRQALIVSALMVIGSLWSKETAVGLPFVLLATWIFLPRAKRVSIRSLVPHFVILGVYLVFAVGYIHIRAIDFKQVFENPKIVGQSGYRLVFGRNVVDSTVTAFSWAFGIRHGIYGQWPPRATPAVATFMIRALRAIRILICAVALLFMLTPRRGFVLIGLAWFLIAAGPTLPLENHFLPYYMFAPLVGFSLAVGAALDWAYERCAQYSGSLAFAACALVILLFAGINAAEARVAVDGYLLSGSAESAHTAMTDVRAEYPTLPRGTKLVIFDEELPGISWSQAAGMLYQMVYADQSLKAYYTTDGTPVPVTTDDIAEGRAIVFKLSHRRFVNITSFVKQRPELLYQNNPAANFHVELSKAEVRAGGDSYVMQIPELKDVTINLLRAYNGIVEEPFPVKLDDQGRVEFQVGADTKPGTYSLVGVQQAGQPTWGVVTGSIRVK